MVAHGDEMTATTASDMAMSSMSSTMSSSMSMSSSMGSDSSMDMSSMSMTMPMSFFTSTTTSLYSKSWTPSSAGAYAGTCIFLILLAIALRGLFTAKSYLEAQAAAAAAKRRYIVVAGQQSTEEKAFNDASSMTGILTTNGMQENVRIVEAPATGFQPFRFGVDLPRAAIMTVAAGVGYLLMLAVMTYNVGYFMSVLAGSFIGELALGRFMSGSMSM